MTNKQTPPEAPARDAVKRRRITRISDAGNEERRTVNQELDVSREALQSANEDIDTLKQGLLRVKEARDYAEAIVETVREPLVVLSGDFHVVTANKAYYKNFSVTPEEAATGNFFELQNGLWNTPGIRDLLEDVIRENTVFSDLEVAFESPGGGRGTMLLNARKIAREGAELILLAIDDITDRRLAEEQIHALNRDLQRNLNELASANGELESFSYSVSHDLRAPLNRILGFADVLLERSSDTLDDKGKKHLGRIINGAENMNRIIDNLLHLSRISRQSVQRRHIGIGKLAASIAGGLREVQPDRRVEVNIQESINAFADAQLVEIALSNLLSNAWKFTANNANACIEFGSFDQNGKTVYYVKDNGAGFDPRDADRLFQPFQRLHSEQEFEGTGIGLATVERVVRRHGGTIWAEGKTEEGAAFFFTLN